MGVTYTLNCVFHLCIKNTEKLTLSGYYNVYEDRINFVGWTSFHYVQRRMLYRINI